MLDGQVLYEGGLPLGRRDAHDPDLAMDVTARSGVVYLTQSQGRVSCAQLVAELSPGEALELAYALTLASRAADGVSAGRLVSEGACSG